MSRLRILDEAAREVDAAVEYVEQEREGYGLVLLDEYTDKLQQIRRFPQSAPLLRGTPRGYALRAFSLRRFRYSIIVGEVEGIATIIAFAHHSRTPDYWYDRLR